MNDFDSSRLTTVTADDSSAGAVAGSTANQEWAELLAFFVQGDAKSPPPGRTVADQLTAALLYPYRDHSNLRYRFPICVSDGEKGSLFAQSLTALFNGLIASTCGQDEGGERRKRDVLKLEAVIRRIAESGTCRLSEVWERAQQQLISDLSLQGEKQQRLIANLDAARAALVVDGLLLGCDEKTPVQLARAAMASTWMSQVGDFAEELAELVHRLESRLQAEFARSAGALSAQHLQASVATGREDELDFDVLSSLLVTSERAPEMPLRRQERMRRALGVLKKLQPLFDTRVPFEGEPPVLLDTMTESCDDALSLHQGLSQTMVGFFAALRIARLELAEAYLERLYDPFFARFCADDLEDEERRLCPPTLLVLGATSISAADQRKVIDLLNSGMPIKVLALIPDVCNAHFGDDDLPGCGWIAQLPQMVMTLNRAYVLQTTNANVEHLLEGLASGLRYAGPALFSIYAGSGLTNPGLSPYLVAASALESRAIPALAYDPSAGETWAERFSLDGNPDLDEDWAADEYAGSRLPFTIADFLAGDSRCAQYFRRISDDLSNDSLIPVGDFLSLAAHAQRGKLPFLVMIDQHGEAHRVVPSRVIVRAAQHARRNWHSLQELAGINNSHVARQVSAEVLRLAAEKDALVAKIASEFEQRIDANVAGLTEAIVRRIAAGLLDQAQGPMVLTPSPSAVSAVGAPAVAPVSAPAAAVPAEAPASDDDEDELVVSDDPYIDTALCTSCNECTNMNGLLFAYDGNKQAFIKDPTGGPFADLVRAAELCPVGIIHPGKPKNPSEPGLDALVERAKKFN